jgi:hypothetical protein
MEDRAEYEGGRHDVQATYLVEKFDVLRVLASLVCLMILL